MEKYKQQEKETTTVPTSNNKHPENECGNFHNMGSCSLPLFPAFSGTQSG